MLTLIQFLSTLSLRRATQAAQLMEADTGISIHALLAESDGCFFCVKLLLRSIFLSTLSLRRATRRRTYQLNEKQAFLSTLSLRRATRQNQHQRKHKDISIHALLAESDSIIDIINDIINNFYPRSPCGERPVTRVARTPTTVISIHALLAESDITEGSICLDSRISIHALLAESDSTAFA